MFSFELDTILLITLPTLAFFLVSFYIFDLYDIRVEFKTFRCLTLIVESLLFTTLLMIVFLYIYPIEAWSRAFFLDLILTGFFITLWHLYYSVFLKLTIPKRNIVIIGPAEKANAVHALLGKYPEYQIIASIDAASSPLKIPCDHRIDDIIVTTYPVKSESLDRELVRCKLEGIDIYDKLTLYEAFMYKVPVGYIQERWIVDSQGLKALNRTIYTRLKGLGDILTSLAFLAILFPLGLIISIAIKLTSKGPVFFIQERIGLNHKVFRLIKFRTMVKGAEKKDPKWADRDDPRVTAVGKILRRTRLDELPQLINVLKGEMSIIGPRPEREFFIEKLIKKIPHYSLRFSVKPGLTGWAQVNSGYAASEKDAVEKLEYDLYYVKNISFFLDFRIFLKTIRTIIFGMGR